ncbi:12383_t:CDS:2, partial [Funneliformis mosseae]
VLQNTLVAQNLQQANRIAFTNTRWRVVTLSGQLIDKSGTMSGGGNQVFKDAMNSKFSPDITSETIAKLEKVRSHFEMQWKELNENVRSLEPQLQGKKDKKRKVAEEAHKTHEELKTRLVAEEKA